MAPAHGFRPAYRLISTSNVHQYVYPIVTATIIAFLLELLIVGVLLLFWVYRKQTAIEEDDDLNKVELGKYFEYIPSDRVNEESVYFVEFINRGRYGEVWKGTLNKETVAIKVIGENGKSSWENEIYIYNLPNFSHPNVSQLLGTRMRSKDFRLECWLITEYCSRRSLFEHLRENVLSLEDLYLISKTMMNGLTYLHGGMHDINNTSRLSIAHRDFKSKHVLLKSDLTACITDFGAALILNDNKNLISVSNAVRQWCGTLNYLAPEQLRGGIFISKNSFLSTDMYACGLVLWEMLSRCDANGGPVFKHQIPYESVVGPRPSFKDMVHVVLHKKLMPPIEKHWHNHPGLSVFIDTIVDCWDIDPEARLTANCVLERINRLDVSDDSGNNSIVQSDVPESVVKNPINSSSDILDSCTLTSVPGPVLEVLAKETMHSVKEQ